MEQPRKINVLIVDDDRVDREMYVRYLSQIHSVRYHICEADSFRVALEYHQAGVPDVILLDYSLPDRSGLEFMQAIANNDGDVLTPVIMLAGMGSEKLAVQCIKLGAKDYLSKDKVTPRVLHEAIQSALKKDDRSDNGGAKQYYPASSYVGSSYSCAVPPSNWIRI